MPQITIYKELKEIFRSANHHFVSNNKSLLESKVSERTLSGSLMLCLQQALENTRYSDYYADVEYNRNINGKLKTIVKKNNGNKFKIITINCDLIVHSRGEISSQDNLIAIEMKKSYRPEAAKKADKERLMCLTKDSFDDVWSFDGHTLPEHVCRYVLGIYYEINYNKRAIILEYYYKGKKKSSDIISF